MVAEELPAPIGPEFQTLYDQQNFGLPLSQALKNFADRVVILDARFFVTAVLTQKEAGGNLSEVLDKLAAQWDEITQRVGVDNQKAVYKVWAAKPGLL